MSPDTVQSRGRLACAICFLLFAGCSERSRLDGDPSYHYERLEVRSVTTTGSRPRTNDRFERLTKLELAHDQQSFYVLDVTDKTVHRVDLDGGILASMGGGGEGPGELDEPSEVIAAPGGVWVLDAGARAVLFGPDGDEMAVLSFEGIWTPNLVPATDGVILTTIGPLDDDDGVGLLLLHVTADGRSTIGTGAVEIPDGFVGSDPDDLMHMVTWAVTSISEHEFAIVTNDGSLDGWRVAVDNEYRQVTEIKPLAIPEGISALVRSIEIPAPGMTLMAVSGTRVVDGKHWVVTAGLGPDLLAFTVPSAVGERVTLLFPGELTGRDVRDAIVLSDRVVAITSTEILVGSVRPIDG